MRVMAMPCDRGGCGWYRVRQPMAMIKEFTEHDTYIVEKDSDAMEDIVKALPSVDVVVVRQGVPIKETKAKFTELYGKELKAKWVMDIDDNMELISPYSDHYRDNGIEEIYDKNLGKWLWKDGESGLDIAQNKLKIKKAEESLVDADLVTATTDKLAEFAKGFNKNVRVLPNSINFDSLWKLPLKTNKQLRVGWSGGTSHYEDWFSIKEPLNKLLREYKFKLVMAGNHFKGTIDEDLRHLVEYHPWIDFTGHSYRMMCLNLDLAIIPLADLPFNHFKSSIKWYEMSAIRVPSVVSMVGPYPIDIVDGDTALGYVDAISFVKSLSSLLESVSLRKKIGKNAYNWVFKHRNAKTNARMWTDAYKSLWTN